MTSCYKVDDSALRQALSQAPVSNWILAAIATKIDELSCMPNPRSGGGEYRGKWLYPIGKHQLVCQIDDAQRVIYVLKLLSLP